MLDGDSLGRTGRPGGEQHIGDIVTRQHGMFGQRQCLLGEVDHVKIDYRHVAHRRHTSPHQQRRIRLLQQQRQARRRPLPVQRQPGRPQAPGRQCRHQPLGRTRQGQRHPLPGVQPLTTHGRGHLLNALFQLRITECLAVADQRRGVGSQRGPFADALGQRQARINRLRRWVERQQALTFGLAQQGQLTHWAGGRGGDATQQHLILLKQACHGHAGIVCRAERQAQSLRRALSVDAHLQNQFKARIERFGGTG
ncbi:hypothetical protein D3C77_342600 [compost metagenome]